MIRENYSLLWVDVSIFTPLLHISALPLLSCQFPTKSHHPAAASNSEPENWASGNITAPCYNCVTSVREKLKPPSHLVWLRDDGFEPVWWGAWKSWWVMFQSSSDSGAANRGSTGTQRGGNFWQHCHPMVTVLHYNNFFKSFLQSQIIFNFIYYK